MYCIHCGKQINEGSRFCTFCGQPQGVNINEGPEYNKSNQQEQQSQQTQQSQQYQQSTQNYGAAPGAEQANYQGGVRYNGAYQLEHPYRRFGGWVLFFAVLWIIGGIISIFGIIASFSSFSFIGDALGLFGGPSIAMIFFEILAVAGGVLGAVCGIGMFYKLYKKDIGFLRFYELMTVISIGLSVLQSIVMVTMMGGLIEFLNPIPSIFGGIIVSIIIFVLMLYYFTHSVHVRTYFRSGAYINNTLFVKNITLPTPAIPDDQN